MEHLRILNGRFKGLRVLQLKGCHKLLEHPSSTGGLASLEELDLSWCSDLSDLSDSPYTIGNLVQLCLAGCKILWKLLTTLGNLKQHKLLDLTWCTCLEDIPTSIDQLTKLECLVLNWCRALLAMCEFDTRMAHLSKLNLRECWRLKSFKSLRNLDHLQALDISKCGELCIPNLAGCLGQMSGLQYVNLYEILWSEVYWCLSPDSSFPDLEHLGFSDFPEDNINLPFCPRLKFLRVHSGSKWFPQSLLESFDESLGSLKCSTWKESPESRILFGI